MTTRQATIVSGANEQTVDLPEGTCTVTDLANRYGEVLNIRRADLQVHVNGEPAALNRPIEPGDRVEFLRPAGQKA